MLAQLLKQKLFAAPTIMTLAKQCVYLEGEYEPRLGAHEGYKAIMSVAEDAMVYWVKQGDYASAQAALESAGELLHELDVKVNGVPS